MYRYNFYNSKMLYLIAVFSKSGGTITTSAALSLIACIQFVVLSALMQSMSGSTPYTAADSLIQAHFVFSMFEVVHIRIVLGG